MKKTILFLLIVTLLAMAVPAGLAETAAPLVNTTGQPVTLKVFRPMDANLQDYIKSWNDTPFYQELEKETGVHIEFVEPATTAAKENLNMLMVSGDMPDIIICSDLYAAGTYQAVQDGYYIDLAPYLQKDAPEYYSIISGNDSIWRDSVSADGTVSAMYRIFSQPNPAWMRLVLKQETLDKLGVTAMPVTIADWDALFAKMLAAGITPFMLANTGYDEKFIGAYDVRQDFYKEGDTVKYGQIQDGFKKYLELMHDWYAKGYISKDFVSASNVDTMFSMDQIGTYDKPIVAAYNFGKKEGYTVVSSPYPRQTADQFLHWDSYKASVVGKTMVYGCVSVTASCKDPDMAVKWLNFLFTKPGMTLSNWGIKGLNYDVVDGKNQYLPAQWDYNGISQEGLNYYFKSHNAATYADPDTLEHANLLKSPEAAAIRMEYDDDKLLDSALYLPSVSLTAEESDTRAKIMTDIDTYVDEMVLKYIIGTESLDNWDTFVKTVQDMGIDQAVAVTQAAYDRYMAVTVK